MFKLIKSIRSIKVFGSKCLKEVKGALDDDYLCDLKHLSDLYKPLNKDK